MALRRRGFHGYEGFGIRAMDHRHGDWEGNETSVSAFEESIVELLDDTQHLLTFSF